MEPTRFWLEIHTDDVVQDEVADAYADEHFPVQYGWSLHEVVEDGDEYHYIFHSNTDPKPSLEGFLQHLAPETLAQCLMDVYQSRGDDLKGYADYTAAIQAEVEASHRTEGERHRAFGYQAEERA